MRLTAFGDRRELMRVISALSAALLGFLLGLKHATDADHVVAITTIVSRERSFTRAAWIGGLWGIGHSLTVFLVGGALVIFRIAMPPRVGLTLEFSVALMLIILGFNNLRPANAPKPHSHDIPARFNGIRPVIIGIVHGLAGRRPRRCWCWPQFSDTMYALAYLFIFGVGTIAGMTLITAILAVPSVYAADRVVRLQGGIRLAAGALSLVFGICGPRNHRERRGSPTSRTGFRASRYCAGGSPTAVALRHRQRPVSSQCGRGSVAPPQSAISRSATMMTTETPTFTPSFTPSARSPDKRGHRRSRPWHAAARV